MLIDPPVLQARKKKHTPKQKLHALDAKMKKFLMMKNEHLGKIP